jgi:hypothetical protein
MKLIKLTLLAATAAVVAMAFIGGSAASAASKHPWIAICFEQKLLQCASRPKHPLLGKLRLLISISLFKAGFSIECQSGEGETNEVESQQPSESFKTTLETVTAKECSGGCKAVKVITPQLAEGTMESEAEESWRLKSNNAKVEFSECSFGVKCKFEGNLNFKIGMDSEGDFADPEGTSFKLIEGSKLLCGETGKWESGRIRFDWVLDGGVVHKNVWLSLVAELVKIP